MSLVVGAEVVVGVGIVLRVVDENVVGVKVGVVVDRVVVEVMVEGVVVDGVVVDGVVVGVVDGVLGVVSGVAGAGVVLSSMVV